MLRVGVRTTPAESGGDSVAGTRLVIASVVLLGITVPVLAHADNNGLFNRKPRVEQSRVRFLAELLRTETDEKKARAAVLELADADPRVHPEVLATLLAALKKEAATVRAAAAEVIGRFKTVFPQAGAALEHTAEFDADATVRETARQALWEYHLNGYRSAKGTDQIAPQTIEPPFASARLQEPPSTIPPLAVPPANVTLPTPPILPTHLSVQPLPPVEPLRGPRVRQAVMLSNPRSLLSLPPTRSDEPPVARRPEKWKPPTATMAEPPIIIQRPEPAIFGKPPVIFFELPTIVPPPGPIPGSPVSPDPTTEPPVRKAGM